MNILNILEKIGLCKITIEYDYNQHCIDYENQLAHKECYRPRQYGDSISGGTGGSINSNTIRSIDELNNWSHDGWSRSERQEAMRKRAKALYGDDPFTNSRE